MLPVCHHVCSFSGEPLSACHPLCRLSGDLLSVCHPRLPLVFRLQASFVYLLAVPALSLVEAASSGAEGEQPPPRWRIPSPSEWLVAVHQRWPETARHRPAPYSTFSDQTEEAPNMTTRTLSVLEQVCVHFKISPTISPPPPRSLSPLPAAPFFLPTLMLFYC